MSAVYYTQAELSARSEQWRAISQDCQTIILRCQANIELYSESSGWQSILATTKELSSSRPRLDDEDWDSRLAHTNMQLERIQLRCSQEKENDRKKNRQFSNTFYQMQSELQNKLQDHQELVQQVLELDRRIQLCKTLSTVQRSELTGTLQNVHDQTDFDKVEAMLSQHLHEESKRKQTVFSVMDLLIRQGFQCSKPEIRIQRNGQNLVFFIAKKAHGRTVEVYISHQNQITWDLHGYPGMACMEDLKKFQEQLHSCYDLDLIDGRIIEQNPDRLYADSRQQPTEGSQDRR